MVSFLFRGLIVGLAVAIPIGPVGLLCLENTVTRGRRAGLSCASGMVLADIFSASMMLVGFGLFYDTLMDHEWVFKLVTGCIFVTLGALIFRGRHDGTKSTSQRAIAGLSLSSFLLAVSPATFALMLFLFPTLGLTGEEHQIAIVAGVALGSAAWCALILGAGAFIRKCLGENLAKFKTVVGCLFMAAGMLGIFANWMVS